MSAETKIRRNGRLEWTKLRLGGECDPLVNLLPLVFNELLSKQFVAVFVQDVLVVFISPFVEDS